MFPRLGRRLGRQPPASRKLPFQGLLDIRRFSAEQPPIAFDLREQFVAFDYSAYLASTDADEGQASASEEAWSEESEVLEQSAESASADEEEESHEAEESDEEDSDE